MRELLRFKVLFLAPVFFVFLSNTSLAITFSGSVTISSGALISDATVEMVGYPAVSTTTDGSGSYSLSGLPAGTDFSMKISKDGYLPVYTNTINSSSDITDPVPAVLFTLAEASGWGVTSEKGVIAAYAVDAANLSSFLSGATVTASSAMNPITPYTVTYSGGGSSTSTDGLVFVLNVDDGDTVTLHTTKDGWSFQDAVFTVHGDSLSEGLLEGVMVISFQGIVTDLAGAPLSGATVEMDGSPTVFTTTDSNGNFSLTLPAGTDLTVKISNTGYLPVYTNTINFSSDTIDPIPFKLLSQDQMSAWGVDLGKGAIAACAVNATTGYLSGAVVAASSSKNPTIPYTVTYDNSGSSTSSSGMVYVLNVEDGDTVTLHTTKDGWFFSDVVFTVHGNAASEGLLLGVPQKVRIKNISKYLTTLQSAYDDTGSSSVNPIQAVVDDFSENLTANLSKAVTLTGGFDSGYSSKSGLTSLLGVLTIESGSLTVENVIIR